MIFIFITIRMQILQQVVLHHLCSFAFVFVLNIFLVIGRIYFAICEQNKKLILLKNLLMKFCFLRPD